MLATSMWPGNVYYNAPWTLYAQWEIKLPCKLFVCHLIEWVRSISHRRTQKNRTHKVSQRHQVNRFHRTLQPSLAVTFCEFCMPEAFCEFETVRKKVLLSLWVLWEKKLPAILKRPFSYSGCVLFLTDLHRWTEHTKAKKMMAPPPSPPPKGGA